MNSTSLFIYSSLCVLRVSASYFLVASSDREDASNSGKRYISQRRGERGDEDKLRTQINSAFFLCELCVLCESPLQSGSDHALIYSTENTATFFVEHLDAHAVAEL